jgi:hypothetical protein
MIGPPLSQYLAARPIIDNSFYFSDITGDFEWPEEVGSSAYSPAKAAHFAV